MEQPPRLQLSGSHRDRSLLLCREEVSLNLPNSLKHQRLLSLDRLRDHNVRVPRVHHREGRSSHRECRGEMFKLEHLWSSPVLLPTPKLQGWEQFQ